MIVLLSSIILFSDHCFGGHFEKIPFKCPSVCEKMLQTIIALFIDELRTEISATYVKIT